MSNTYDSTSEPSRTSNQKSTFVEVDPRRAKRKTLLASGIVVVALAVVVGATLITNVIIGSQNHVEAVQNAEVNFTRTGVSPATIQIRHGSSVTWTNQYKGTYHLVSDDQNAFAADIQLDTGSSFTAIFNTAGTYHYHIADNPALKGVIIVQ